jgi:hypothetical protein
VGESQTELRGSSSLIHKMLPIGVHAKHAVDSVVVLNIDQIRGANEILLFRSNWDIFGFWTFPGSCFYHN